MVFLRGVLVLLAVALVCTSALESRSARPMGRLDDGDLDELFRNEEAATIFQYALSEIHRASSEHEEVPTYDTEVAEDLSFLSEEASTAIPILSGIRDHLVRTKTFYTRLVQGAKASGCSFAPREDNVEVGLGGTVNGGLTGISGTVDVYVMYNKITDLFRRCANLAAKFKEIAVNEANSKKGETVSFNVCANCICDDEASPPQLKCANPADTNQPLHDATPEEKSCCQCVHNSDGWYAASGRPKDPSVCGGQVKSLMDDGTLRVYVAQDERFGIDDKFISGEISIQNAVFAYGEGKSWKQTFAFTADGEHSAKKGSNAKSKAKKKSKQRLSPLKSCSEREGDEAGAPCIELDVNFRDAIESRDIAVDPGELNNFPEQDPKDMYDLEAWNETPFGSDNPCDDDDVALGIKLFGTGDLSKDKSTAHANNKMKTYAIIETHGLDKDATGVLGRNNIFNKIIGNSKIRGPTVQIRQMEDTNWIAYNSKVMCLPMKSVKFTKSEGDETMMLHIKGERPRLEVNIWRDVTGFDTVLGKAIFPLPDMQEGKMQTLPPDAALSDLEGLPVDLKMRLVYYVCPTASGIAEVSKINAYDLKVPSGGNHKLYFKQKSWGYHYETDRVEPSPSPKLLPDKEVIPTCIFRKRNMEAEIGEALASCSGCPQAFLGLQLKFTPWKPPYVSAPNFIVGTTLGNDDCSRCTSFLGPPRAAPGLANPKFVSNQRRMKDQLDAGLPLSLAFGISMGGLISISDSEAGIECGPPLTQCFSHMKNFIKRKMSFLSEQAPQEKKSKEEMKALEASEPKNKAEADQVAEPKEYLKLEPAACTRVGCRVGFRAGIFSLSPNIRCGPPVTALKCLWHKIRSLFPFGREDYKVDTATAAVMGSCRRESVAMCGLLMKAWARKERYSAGKAITNLFNSGDSYDRDAKDAVCNKFRVKVGDKKVDMEAIQNSADESIAYNLRSGCYYLWNMFKDVDHNEDREVFLTKFPKQSSVAGLDEAIRETCEHWLCHTQREVDEAEKEEASKAGDSSVEDPKRFVKEKPKLPTDFSDVNQLAAWDEIADEGKAYGDSANTPCSGNCKIKAAFETVIQESAEYWKEQAKKYNGKGGGDKEEKGIMSGLFGSKKKSKSKTDKTDDVGKDEKPKKKKKKFGIFHHEIFDSFSQESLTTWTCPVLEGEMMESIASPEDKAVNEAFQALKSLAMYQQETRYGLHARTNSEAMGSPAAVALDHFLHDLLAGFEHTHGTKKFNRRK